MYQGELDGGGRKIALLHDNTNVGQTVILGRVGWGY